eukprot:250502-Chlamydomonas_euryale.AAC.22
MRRRAHLDPLCFSFVLGDAHGRNFWVCVADRWHRCVVDVALLTSDDLGCCHAVFLSLVRKHRAVHDVADCVHTGDIGAKVVVDHDAPALRLNAGLLQAETSQVGAAADGHEHGLGLHAGGITAL